MRCLTLAGQLLGATGAICTVFYPFERMKGVSGEIRGGVVRTYPNGPPLWRQLLTQPRWTSGGLALIALGFLLQAAGTVWGL